MNRRNFLKLTLGGTVVATAPHVLHHVLVADAAPTAVDVVPKPVVGFGMAQIKQEGAEVRYDPVNVDDMWPAVRSWWNTAALQAWCHSQDTQPEN